MNRGGGAGGDIFVFVLTKTKINENIQKWFASRKYKETRLLVKWRCFK